MSFQQPYPRLFLTQLLLDVSLFDCQSLVPHFSVLCLLVQRLRALNFFSSLKACPFLCLLGTLNVRLFVLAHLREFVLQLFLATLCSSADLLELVVGPICARLLAFTLFF